MDDEFPQEGAQGLKIDAKFASAPEVFCASMQIDANSEGINECM